MPAAAANVPLAAATRCGFWLPVIQAGKFASAPCAANRYPWCAAAWPTTARCKKLSNRSVSLIANSCTPPRRTAKNMIEARRLQQSFADGFLAEAVGDLWEPWMRHADKALQDEKLLLLIQQELAKRCKKSKTRGRPATPAEVVFRMLLLKHIRDWSFEVLSREVRANLVYREFTRIGGGKVPDDKTMGRLARQLGPAVVEKIHQRIVEIAR